MRSDFPNVEGVHMNMMNQISCVTHGLSRGITNTTTNAALRLEDESLSNEYGRSSVHVLLHFGVAYYSVT